MTAHLLEKRLPHLQQHFLLLFLAVFLPPAFLAFFLAMAHLLVRSMQAPRDANGVDTQTSIA